MNNNLKNTDIEVDTVDGVKKPEKGVEMKYRYACQACTNVAFISTDLVKFTKIVCQSCLKELSDCKLENYILINQNEG